jgi:hypothetical protein
MSVPGAASARLSTPVRLWPAWLQEPLLHFVLLGALLFVADLLLFERSEDPNTIVVPAEVDKEARELFKSARGQEPSAEQMAALRQVWLDNEVLYREGLALRVDQGDVTIRERVIFKALNIVETQLKNVSVDDATLRAWYDEPTRYDFQEAVLTGDNNESAVRNFVAELNRNTGGDVKAGLRIFKGRPHASLVQTYGDQFAKALEELPPGEWRAMKTSEGWRAMRLEAVSPGKPAAFEPLRGVVMQDWTDAKMSEQRTAAVRTLARKYTVRYEGAAK